MLDAKVSTFSDISKHFSNFFLHGMPEGLKPSGWVDVAAQRRGAVSPELMQRLFLRTGREGAFIFHSEPKKTASALYICFSIIIIYSVLWFVL